MGSCRAPPMQSDTFYGRLNLPRMRHQRLLTSVARSPRLLLLLKGEIDQATPPLQMIDPVTTAVSSDGIRMVELSNNPSRSGPTHT